DLIIWRGLDGGKKLGTTVGRVPAIALVRGEADPIEGRLELRDELLRRLPKLRLLFAQILGQPRDLASSSKWARRKAEHGCSTGRGFLPRLLVRELLLAKLALVRDVSDLGL